MGGHYFLGHRHLCAHDFGNNWTPRTQGCPILVHYFGDSQILCSYFTTFPVILRLFCSHSCFFLPKVRCRVAVHAYVPTQGRTYANARRRSAGYAGSPSVRIRIAPPHARSHARTTTLHVSFFPHTALPGRWLHVMAQTMEAVGLHRGPSHARAYARPWCRHY